MIDNRSEFDLGEAGLRESENPELSRTRQRMYNTAIRILASREHSCAELETKLSRKYSSVDREDIETLVSHLQEQGLVDDIRFIETLVRSRINRGYGPFYIQQELKSKGVSGRLAEDVEEWQEANWFTLAEELIERKFGQEQCGADPKIWNKALRLLQRRGFAGSVAYDVLPEMPKT